MPMKTIRLDNLEMLAIIAKACFIPLTFEMINGWPVWNEKIDFADKFVVLASGEIIAGPIGDHRALLACYAVREMSVEAAVDQMKRGRDDQWKALCAGMEVIGAGAVKWWGAILDWTSAGFKVTTPVEMRDRIKKELCDCIELW